jgi:hypothetical protein
MSLQDRFVSKEISLSFLKNFIALLLFENISTGSLPNNLLQA